MREISPTSIFTIGIVISTILGLLKVLGVIPDWWPVLVPLGLLMLYIIVYIAIALIEDFKH